jgi:hypothetical protein
MKGIRADGVSQAAAAVRQIQMYNSGACFCQDMWSSFWNTPCSATSGVVRTVSLVNNDGDADADDNCETSGAPGCEPCSIRVQNMEHARSTHWLMFCAVLDVVRLADGASKSGADGAGSGGLRRRKGSCRWGVGVSARDGLFSPAIIKFRILCSWLRLVSVRIPLFLFWLRINPTLRRFDGRGST